MKSEYQRGDIVAALIYGGGKAFDGSCAEYVMTHRLRTFKITNPRLSWEVLGAIPLTCITAYGSLFISADAKSTLQLWSMVQ